MLGPQNLAFLLRHRREILDTFRNLHTAESAECDAVTRLTKPEPGLQHRIQETCFVNDSHLAARGLEMNGRHLEIEFWETQSLTSCAPPAPCSLINPPQRPPALQAYETWGGRAEFLIPKSEMGGRVGIPNSSFLIPNSQSSFRSAAARSSSSRKSGWEMSIRLRALSLMLRPKRLAMPYSVTTK